MSGADFRAIWGYGKNYYAEERRPHKVSLKMLFEKISRLTEEEPEAKMKTVVQWKFNYEDESILEALL